MITGSDPRLERVAAFYNGKGGVGKSSMASNVAGQLAKDGARVLVVNFDVQISVEIALGLVQHEGLDKGIGIVNTILQDTELNIIEGVRHHPETSGQLDVVPGGPRLEMIAQLGNSPQAAGFDSKEEIAERFAIELARVADAYDYIFIDCPPGLRALQEIALLISRWVLIPSKTDPYSWDGLRRVGPMVKQAQKLNPMLGYLGIVLFAHDPQATRVRRNMYARLESVEARVPIFKSFVRHSEAAAQDGPTRGQLAHELAGDVAEATRERLNVLRAIREKKLTAIPETQALSRTAVSLAEDYLHVTAELLTCINAREAELQQLAVGE